MVKTAVPLNRAPLGKMLSLSRVPVKVFDPEVVEVAKSPVLATLLLAQFPENVHVVAAVPIRVRIKDPAVPRAFPDGLVYNGNLSVT